MNEHNSSYTPQDFGQSPLMFYYEITLACDLVCKHCRASAQADPHPDELSTARATALIDQVASFPRRPNLVLTGGDPLKRADLFALIRHAADAGLHVALTPSATPLATFEAFQRAKEAGVRALGISLDGAGREVHDAFRGWEGSFRHTLEMLDNARRLQLPVQVNTAITSRNFHQVDALADLLAEQGIAMWSVFFLVPVGRGVEEQRISPEQYEMVFERLWHHARRQPYGVKTTEAPHYRRFVLQRGGDPLAGPGCSAPASSPLKKGATAGLSSSAGENSRKNTAGQASSGTQTPKGQLFQRAARVPLGVGDGKGVMFVSHTGEIFPAGFLPLCCGRFPTDSVVDVYQNHPTFVSLRDADRLKGRCGVCEYRHVCGGSRARAFALTGDFMQTDPDCNYVPGSGGNTESKEIQ